MLEIKAITSESYANELSEQFMSLGASAITFQDAGDQPIYEPHPDTPRLWQHTVVTALFEAQLDLPPIIQQLENQQAAGLLKNFAMHTLLEQDWIRMSLDRFTPLQFGKRLWICPSWHVPPDQHGVNVILDPGLAFGTGTHPTTALCLAWLDAHVSPDTQIIDYGCGSGILGIAALKLGAKRLMAIDHDPQALLATRQNLARNGISPAVFEIHSPPVHSCHGSHFADILIANILAEPLIELAETFSQLVKPQGKIALSGILSPQTSRVQNAYNQWFNMEILPSHPDWILLQGTRKA